MLPSVFTIVCRAKTGQGQEKQPTGRQDLPQVRITLPAEGFNAGKVQEMHFVLTNAVTEIADYTLQLLDLSYLKHDM